MPIPVWNIQLRDGGKLLIDPEAVQIIDPRGREIVCWCKEEWDEEGNAEAAQACLNAMLLAMLGGGSQTIIDRLNVHWDEEGKAYVPREQPELPGD